MNHLPYSEHDPQDRGPQYLEDLATGYWFSQTLFTAVELRVFNLLEPGGKRAAEIAGHLELSAHGLDRFLQALCAMGLLCSDGEKYYNTKISSDYLVTGKELYQGESVLWRKYLTGSWQNLAACLEAGGRVDYSPPEEDPQETLLRIRRYIRAMDCVARAKVREILPFFAGCPVNGDILDVGAGSGAMTEGFLQRFPAVRATLMDLPEVLEYTGELMSQRGLADRVNYCPANILEPWPLSRGQYGLVILSNIVHAYAEEEIAGVLRQAAQMLKPDGIMVVHDFFFEHNRAKAGLFDLNMLINTYNGRVFTAAWIRERLAGLNLYATEMIPLTSDTAVIFAAKNDHALAGLGLDYQTRLAARIRSMGFDRVIRMRAEDIPVPAWTVMKCRYGCAGYGKRHCPPNSPSPDETRGILKEYRHALLLQGQPPTGHFQRLVLEAEKEAFKTGFPKAMAFWAGPCAVCDACAGDGACRNPEKSRPSMEGAGMDVFETVRRAGIGLSTLRNRDEYAKYFALLLLE